MKVEKRWFGVWGQRKREEREREDYVVERARHVEREVRTVVVRERLVLSAEVLRGELDVELIA